MKTYDIKDYIGKRISAHIIVIGIDKNYNGNAHNTNHWLFKCDCGNVFSASPSRVLSGHKQSCGCQRYKGCITHGLHKNEFYSTWYAMMQRCYNPKNYNYSRYGGRGIRVCEEWHNIENFVEWAKSTVTHKVKGLTMDRKDNDGNYCPENCKWSTPQQQARNRQKTICKTINGETKSFMDWCEFYNIKEYIVRTRCNKLGWSFEDAVKTPVNVYNPHLKNRKRESTMFMVEIDGIKKCISDWCKDYGINRGMVYHRIQRGMNPVDAITTPRKK